MLNEVGICSANKWTKYLIPAMIQLWEVGGVYQKVEGYLYTRQFMTDASINLVVASCRVSVRGGQFC